MLLQITRQGWSSFLKLSGKVGCTPEIKINSFQRSIPIAGALEISNRAGVIAISGEDRAKIVIRISDSGTNCTLELLKLRQFLRLHDLRTPGFILRLFRPCIAGLSGTWTKSFLDIGDYLHFFGRLLVASSLFEQTTKKIVRPRNLPLVCGAVVRKQDRFTQNIFGF